MAIRSLPEMPGYLVDIADLWVVGGAVRDAAMGRVPAELDLAGPRPAWEAAASLLEDRHGPGHEVGHRYSTLRFGGAGVVDLSLAEEGLEPDLARRDYTANAIAWRPDRGHMDPLGGLADIAAGRLSPASPTALADDPLRVLRGARLAASHRLLPDQGCLRAMRSAAPGLSEVAGERVRDEFARGFGAAPGPFARQLDASGALEALFPFWEAMRKTPAGSPDDVSVAEHSMRVVEMFAMAVADPGEAVHEWKAELEAWQQDLGPVPWWWHLAALLHDAGKPATVETVDGRRRYTRHPSVGADLVKEALGRMRLAGRETEEILAIVGGHLRVSQVASDDGVPGKRARYRYFRDLGRLAIPLVLHDWADANGYPDEVRDEILDPRHRRIHRELLAAAFAEPDSVDPPALVSGHDLASLGYEPGPRMGEALEAVRLAQVDGEVSTHTEALAFARRLLAEGP